MSCLVSGIAIWFFCYGLWTHDWKIIVASALIAFLWPLVSDEVYSVREERQHRELLDRLWDDDDLSDSA